MSSSSDRMARSSAHPPTTPAPNQNRSFPSSSATSTLTKTPENRVSSQISNERPAPDKVIADIADYALVNQINSDLAYETAHYCLLDTLGCGLEALEYPACTKLLGPIVPGATVPNGARVPGTSFQLDPVQAA